MFRIDKLGSNAFQSHKTEEEEELEQKCLESIVFNQPNLSKLHEKNKEIQEQQSDEEIDEQQIAFIIDKAGDASLKLDSQGTSEKRAVWEDEDDEIGFSDAFITARKKPKSFGPDNKYKEYLEKKFTELNPQPKWAQQKKGLEDDDEDAFERVAGDLLSGKASLTSESLRFKSAGRIDKSKPGKNTLCSVDFHPLDSYVSLAARTSVKIFFVDEKQNKKVKQIAFDDFPIGQASFSPQGEELLITSNHRAGRLFYFDFVSEKLIKVPLKMGTYRTHFRHFSYSPNGSLIAGAAFDDRLHLMDRHSKQIVSTLQVNASCESLTFTTDSQKVLCHTHEGRVYVFDVRNQRRCLHRFTDEGCIRGTSIARSPDGSLLACGQESGIVNVYSLEDAMSNVTPVPLKRIDNLVTPVDRIRFNHSGELMTIASSQTDTAIKCVHVPTLKVFADFPQYNVKYGCVSDVAFSPNSYYMGLVNTTGQNYLVRLLNYDKY